MGTVVPFYVDPAWPLPEMVTVTLAYLDVGYGQVRVGDVVWERENTGTDMALSARVPAAPSYTVEAIGSALLLHGFAVGR